MREGRCGLVGGRLGPSPLGFVLLLSSVWNAVGQCPGRETVREARRRPRRSAGSVRQRSFLFAGELSSQPLCVHDEAVQRLQSFCRRGKLLCVPRSRSRLVLAGAGSRRVGRLVSLLPSSPSLSLAPRLASRTAMSSESNPLEQDCLQLRRFGPSAAATSADSPAATSSRPQPLSTALTLLSCAQTRNPPTGPTAAPCTPSSTRRPTRRARPRCPCSPSAAAFG